jgi:Polyketide cyclase / dehydrase and lipid transport
MSQVTNTVTIKGDVQRVFALLTTAKYWTRWHPATIAVRGAVDRPMCPGDRIVERACIAGEIAEGEWHVSELESLRRVVLDMPSTRLGDLRITYSFSELGDGVLFRRELEFDVSRLPEPLRARVERQLEAESEIAVQRCKALVENVFSPTRASLQAMGQ